jgi:hypothetical protein
LAFNSNNPVALVTKAERLRNELLALTAPAKHWELPQRDLQSAREALRIKIRELALRAIASDPLNARAFTLLAEISDGNPQTRMLMREAFRRSRRESVAAFWLLHDSFYKRDYWAVVQYADILLRSRPQLEMPVFSYLSFVAGDDQGRELLKERLVSNPTWRTHFLQAFPSKVKNPETALALMGEMQESGKPLTKEEIKPYLRWLISKGKVELAYNAWLQFLPKSDLEDVGLLTNASFEHEPSGLPFDWRIGKGSNSLAEIIPLADGQPNHVLHITLSDARVQFPEISQALLLKPGRYRFEGKVRGSIIGKRGLRWQLRCLPGEGRVLSETDMLMGQFQQWSFFKLETEVPDLEECRGQVLRLFHDARSASEQLLSGEIWFTNLSIQSSR